MKLVQYLLLLCAIAAGACSNLGGADFRPGETSAADIEAKLGPPTMRWEEPDGSLQFAYASGPYGIATYMAYFGPRPARKLVVYENVLDTAHFGKIQAGMSMEQVQRLIGPPHHPWTAYFKARDELVWEWRYCDAWGEAARFNVLFDGTSKLVRSTLSLTESQRFAMRQSCSRLSVQIGGFGFNTR